jgi:TRAP-type mannitol/chloroaromatic compound transport system permease large subunit
MEALKERLSRIGETSLGIVLAVVPVALWVAWTPIVWAVVIAIGFVAAALLIALGYRRTAEDANSSGEAAPALPDAFVATVHEVFPLTYHHSREGPRRFRDAMEKLRRAPD